VRKVFLLLLAGLSLTGLVGAWYVSHSGSDPDKAGKKQGVYVPDYAAANGIVEGVTPVVEIRSELVGTIASIRYRENEKVSQGSLLIELNNWPQKEQVAVAAAEVRVAEAELERIVNGERQEKRKVAADNEESAKIAVGLAEVKLKRTEEAHAKGVLGAEQLDEALFSLRRAKAEYEKARSERILVEAPAREDEVISAKARIRSANARLSLALAELARTRLLAPSNGTILQRFAEPGDMAGPASARPILVLADLSRLRVRAFVEELDVDRVRPGQRAVVTADGLPGQEFTGLVAQVLPRMGKRGIETDAPGEYKDIYHREVLIDLDEGQALPVSLRVRVRVDTRTPQTAHSVLPPAKPGTADPAKTPAKEESVRVWQDEWLPRLGWVMAPRWWVGDRLVPPAHWPSPGTTREITPVEAAPPQREKTP
jgi:HlyD family secretion protein